VNKKKLKSCLSVILILLFEKMSDQTQFDLPLPSPPPLPLPPTLVLGKFDYIKDISYKNRLVNAFQAITQTETWGFMKKDCDSFMFSKDPLISVISDKMIALGYGLHSGSSFGCTMRDMQYIAKNGEEAFSATKVKNI